MHRTCQSCVILSNTIAGNVMSNPFRFDVTNGFSRQSAIEYDSSLIDSDSICHAGVIMCNIVTNVVRMCLRRLYIVICGIHTCCVPNAAERLQPCNTSKYIVLHRNCQTCVMFSNIIAGRVMSNPFRFDVTNGYSCQIAIKCDCSLINSDALGH